MANRTLPDLSDRFQSAPPCVCTTALSSIGRRSGVAGGGPVFRSASTTTIEKPTMKTAIEKRAAFCQRMIRTRRRWAGPDPLFYAVEALEIRGRELEIR